MENALAGKRVLITQADAFMGPVLCEVFADQGAEVVASADDLAVVDAAERVVRAAGHIDVVVANLAIKAWNLMGGAIDWAALPWVAEYLGIDDLDAAILDMTVIRDWQREH